MDPIVIEIDAEHKDIAHAFEQSIADVLLNRRDGAEKIRAELEASGLEQEGNSECPVHAAITYRTNHRGRFGDASARAAGLPIGSGAVESSCEILFEVRMKRNGSRWREISFWHLYGPM